MTGYDLDDDYLIRGKGREFSINCYIHTPLGSTQPPIWCGSRGSFLVVKRLEHDADYFPTLSADLKNVWSYTSTLPYVFMA
jgi:hypothetical protein